MWTSFFHQFYPLLKDLVHFRIIGIIYDLWPEIIFGQKSNVERQPPEVLYKESYS